jgi:hypothetical protein
VESTIAYQGEHSKAEEVPFLSEYLNSTGLTLDVVEILYFNDNERVCPFPYGGRVGGEAAHSATARLPPPLVRIE